MLTALSRARASAPFSAISRSRKVSFGRKGSWVIGLKLTSAGLKRMKACGATSVKAVAKYHRGRKKASRSAKRFLKSDPSLCPDGPDLPNPTTKAG